MTDNWQKLHDEIVAAHFDTPQRQWHALAALDAAKAALATLATFGHRFDLIEAEPAEPQPWPKAFYHQELGFRAVANEDEAKALGEGWQDTQFPAKPKVQALSNVAPIPVVVVEAPVAPIAPAPASSPPPPAKTVDIAALWPNGPNAPPPGPPPVGLTL
jgi:hypothetical protein